MIRIISGPSCVGKTYFMENKKDRLLEIANLESDDEFEVCTAVEWNVSRNWTNDMWEDGSKLICIHWDVAKQAPPLIKKLENLDKELAKGVIIIGVPYSEYRVRVKSRKTLIHHSGLRTRTIGSVPTYTQILNVYREWIDVLNKNEISYKFVEASGDYKVLEEEEFFRMLND